MIDRLLHCVSPHYEFVGHATVRCHSDASSDAYSGTYSGTYSDAYSDAYSDPYSDAYSCESFVTYSAQRIRVII